MTQLVINLSRVTQQVGIVDDKGRRTSFRLMARGRVETNYEIEPSWLARNPGVIKVVTLAAPVDTTETPTSIASETKKAASKKANAAETVVTSIASDSTTAEGA
jgi:hypothetical protein